MNKEQLKTKEKNLESESINGIGNTQLNESLPNYNNAECEKIIDGKNNVMIVLGRDRPGSLSSGYGGAGQKKCGSLDLVVGRTSAIITEFDKDGNKVYTDPSIEYDAARITISQKTDVDDNFYLPGRKARGRSAAAIKADNLRFVARESIKFVTNADKYDSLGDLKARKYGVEFIANNGEDIQPIPKGDNLKELVEDIYKNISQVQIVHIYKILLTILETLAAHTHMTSFGPSSPSIELIGALTSATAQISMNMVENQIQQVNIEKAKIKYLTPGSEKHIASEYHKLD